ncbi:Sterol O-Acyltransferase 1 [Manis pentadactyla]|nr:Sterol O-Acyltransferase 1 [Manis pentadactyla]
MSADNPRARDTPALRGWAVSSGARQGCARSPGITGGQGEPRRAGSSERPRIDASRSPSLQEDQRRDPARESLPHLLWPTT